MNERLSVCWFYFLRFLRLFAAEPIMKYQIPKLYRIFPLKTGEAACASGDQASSLPSCAAGPEAGGAGGCASGAAASSRCLPGAAAGSKCEAGTGHA